jgi:hypothetical protein
MRKQRKRKLQKAHVSSLGHRGTEIKKEQIPLGELEKSLSLEGKNI